MELFFTLLDMFVAALCLYQAGKFGAVMQYDREVFETKTPVQMHIFYWLNMFFGLYFIICVYGRGLARGAL